MLALEQLAESGPFSAGGSSDRSDPLGYGPESELDVTLTIFGRVAAENNFGIFAFLT